MNSLSWFLYLVDISGGIQAFFGILVGASITAAVGLVIAGAHIRDAYYRGPEDTYERKARGIALQWRSLWLAIPATFFLLIAFLIPSKETLYMIGASQVGEQVIQLEAVKKTGGELGALASDTIALLRQKIQENTTTKSE